MSFVKYLIVTLNLILIAALLTSFGGCQSQPKEQVAVPLENANKTVTAFLEMCKQGKPAEARQKYQNLEHSNPPESAPWQPVLDDVSSYIVTNSRMDLPDVEGVSHPVIEAKVSDTSGNTTNVGFVCSEDGSRIENIFEYEYHSTK